MIRNVVKDFPFKVVATTLRKAKTATNNDWGAICYADGNFYEAPRRENLEIYDRVGGGDSFAAGLIYGFLQRQGSAVGGGMRRCPRRARHDHSGRHDHGHAQGSATGDERRRRAHRPLTSPGAPGWRISLAC